MRIQVCLSGNSKWLQSKFLVVREARKPRPMEEEMEMAFREVGGQDARDARMTQTSLSWWRFYRCVHTIYVYVILNTRGLWTATPALIKLNIKEQN